MVAFFRLMLFLWIVYLPVSSMASGPEVHIAKKPKGLRKENPDPSNPHLTTEDRLKWRSVLNWCDECEERARPRTRSYEGRIGYIYVYSIGGNQSIVTVQCSSSMRQAEHFYYKITEHADTIESRLLILEQFDYISPEGESLGGVEEPTEALKGEFVRYYDSLTYSLPVEPAEHDRYHLKHHIVLEREYRGTGGCGHYTAYDVSGDCPKVVLFRARPYCSSNYVPIEKYKAYPFKQRAKWRIVPSPLRDDWKASSHPAACNH